MWSSVCSVPTHWSRVPVGLVCLLLAGHGPLEPAISIETAARLPVRCFFRGNGPAWPQRLYIDHRDSRPTSSSRVQSWSQWFEVYTSHIAIDPPRGYFDRIFLQQSRVAVHLFQVLLLPDRLARPLLLRLDLCADIVLSLSAFNCDVEFVLEPPDRMASRRRVRRLSRHVMLPMGLLLGSSSRALVCAGVVLQSRFLRIPPRPPVLGVVVSGTTETHSVSHSVGAVAARTRASLILSNRSPSAGLPGSVWLVALALGSGNTGRVGLGR